MNWTPEEDALLGTMTDAKVAVKVGRTPKDVAGRRYRIGVAAFPDEGLMDHSLHTILIRRDGTLAANVEGNQYSSDQLADLLAAVLQ